jgi:hypothetical protein
MSGEIVNLRRARKTKARAEAEAAAAANRLKFGRTKADKELDAARQDRADASLDGHKRDS